MWNYCVTFRIANQTVAGQTYADRYSKFIEAVRFEKAGYWEETTSFLFVESALHTDAFTKRVVQGLSAGHDMVVVFDPTDMSACYFGAVEHVDILRTFLPKLKKLG
jgi:hypothetical protein